MTKPINLVDLHQHFTGVYKLESHQADSMVASSARSIQEVMDKGLVSLRENDAGELANQAHSLKGLLLNMGQQEWAEKAVRLEHAAKENDLENCNKLISDIKEGVKDLWEYNQGEGDKH